MDHLYGKCGRKKGILYTFMYISELYFNINRSKSGRQHNTGKKGRSRVNSLGHGTGIKVKKIEQRMRRLLKI